MRSGASPATSPATSPPTTWTERVGGPRHRGADREQELVATHVAGGAEGVDSVTFLAGPEAYVLHVGAGVAAAGAERRALEVTVPAVLLERACWLFACALEHDDLRGPG